MSKMVPFLVMREWVVVSLEGASLFSPTFSTDEFIATFLLASGSAGVILFLLCIRGPRMTSKDSSTCPQRTVSWSAPTQHPLTLHDPVTPPKVERYYDAPILL